MRTSTDEKGKEAALSQTYVDRIRVGNGTEMNSEMPVSTRGGGLGTSCPLLPNAVRYSHVLRFLDHFLVHRRIVEYQDIANTHKRHIIHK